MEHEIWKDIEGYEGKYMISSMGRVKSLDYRKSGKEGYLSIYTMNTGYLATHLSDNGKEKVVLIHRLIAEAFIPNPDNKPEIDHINTIRTDNRIENLKWVTSKENSNNPLTLNRYVISNNGHKSMLGRTGENNHLSKKVLQLDKQGNVVRLWHSLMDVKRELGFDPGKISACCLGKRLTHKGYRWEYKEKAA